MSSEGHQLHQVQFEGAVEPAGAFAIESRPAPDGVTLMALSGELDIAATSELRACVDRAAGSRGLVLDLAGATFVDSSMLKELLRASVELDRYETRLVLVGIPPAVRRVFDLTRTAELFTIADDRESALAIVGAPAGLGSARPGRRGRRALRLALLGARAGADPAEAGVQEVVAGRRRRGRS